MTVQRQISLGGVAFSSSSPSGEADVFVFDNDRRQRLDTYQRVGVTDGKIEAVSTGGGKIIAVILNSGKDRADWAGIDSYSALEKATVEIYDESSSAPTLSGTMSTTGSLDSDGEICLEPLLSKVSLRSVSCDFSGKAYEGEAITNVKVYLTNVNSVSRILGESGTSVVETINTAGLNSSDLALLRSPGMLSTSLDGDISTSVRYPGIELYCYPNTCGEESLGSHFTRLVIEGCIKGITYYWPIDINRESFGTVYGNPGVERNKNYVFDLKITRSGSFDPDTPVSPADVLLDFSVLDWNEKEETQEYF